MTGTACASPAVWTYGGRVGRTNHPPGAGALVSGLAGGPLSAGGASDPESDDAGRRSAVLGPALAELTDTANRIQAAIETVIEGKPEVIRLAITVLLAEGHLLIEDVPGVGKTMLAKSLARSINCSVQRIQFTPDLMPTDVIGVSVFNQETRDFEFKPGGVFANIVVGDEINRASPKTQSAMLECMEERQVTVDGTTYELDAPFMVIATQNPVEMEGTYPCPRHNATGSWSGWPWATRARPTRST